MENRSVVSKAGYTAVFEPQADGHAGFSVFLLLGWFLWRREYIHGVLRMSSGHDVRSRTSFHEDRLLPAVWRCESDMRPNSWWNAHAASRIQGRCYQPEDGYAECIVEAASASHVCLQTCNKDG